MKITVYIAEKRFAHFNRLIFKGKLKPVPILLSRGRSQIGACYFNKERTPTGIKQTDFNLRFSTAYDLKPRDWDDIIIHEMIHYYIGVNGYRDTSPHGKLFKQLMNEINEKFGRNVTISAKTYSGSTDEATGTKAVVPRPVVKHRYRFVAILTYKDGHRGFKVLPAVYKSIMKYYSVVAASSQFDKVELYQSNNDFFGRYPSSAALKVYDFKEGVYEEVIKRAVPMVITPGRIYAAPVNETKE